MDIKCSLEMRLDYGTGPSPKILYIDTDRICECLFKEEGSVTKIDNVQ